MTEPILRLSNVSKKFSSGDHEVVALRDASFEVEKGSSLSIVGPSGSGKTTLLSLCAGLDRPSSGEVRLAGEQLASLSENERADLRNREVGFVFQNFQLLPTLTALENTMVPLELRGDRRAKEAAAAMLARVGLEERLDHYPSQLSGGEQQRVALARAFVNKPQILFADEPTGNLDEETGAAIVDLLFDLNKQSGTTLVLVTHDTTLSQRTDRVLSIRAASVVSLSETISASTKG